MDTQLRDLQRRYKQSQNPADEAAFLKELLRAREISTEMVQAAAYIGYPAAQLVNDIRPSEAAETNIAYFIMGLQRWGKDIVVEAARSAAITTLRATKAAQDNEALTPQQVKLLSCAIDLTHPWEGKEKDLQALSKQIYEKIYKVSDKNPEQAIGCAFTWLCYAGAWQHLHLKKIPKKGKGVQIAVYAAMQAGLAGKALAPKTVFDNLRTDLARWIFRDING